MNKELYRMWKETSIAEFELLYQHVPGRTEVNHEIVRIVGVPAEIRTGHLTNTSQLAVVLILFQLFTICES
jgi:hypothetical protein